MTALRRAGLADLPRIEALLSASVETSMFPLSNLRTFGLDGAAPRAMRFWIDAAVSVALGVTTDGMALPVLPGFDDWKAVRDALAGQVLIGAAGEAETVRCLLAAAGLAGAPVRLAGDEAHYTLDLTHLAIPDGEGDLAMPDASHQSLLVAWRSAYQREVLGTPDAEADATARVEVADWLAQGSHRLLISPDGPLALTGFNAALPEIVQVGGVYTPPMLRNRGHARRAVALHLVEARSRGCGRAVLFSASPAACRAYRAVGFREVGRFSLVVFDGPQEVA